MSRSRRHIPIAGITTARSEKEDKQLDHRAERGRRGIARPRSEIEDEAAFQRLVVDQMIWNWTTTDAERTKVIGNARRAWHQALRWERDSRAG